MATFTPLSLYLRVNSPRALNGKRGEPQTQPWTFGVQKSRLTLLGMEPRFLSCKARKLPLRLHICLYTYIIHTYLHMQCKEIRFDTVVWQSPVFHRAGPRSIPGQSVWDMRWRRWEWDKYFSQLACWCHSTYILYSNQSPIFRSKRWSGILTQPTSYSLFTLCKLAFKVVIPAGANELCNWKCL